MRVFIAMIGFIAVFGCSEPEVLQFKKGDCVEVVNSDGIPQEFMNELIFNDPTFSIPAKGKAMFIMTTLHGHIEIKVLLENGVYSWWFQHNLEHCAR